MVFAGEVAGGFHGEFGGLKELVVVGNTFFSFGEERSSGSAPDDMGLGGTRMGGLMSTLELTKHFGRRLLTF